MMPLCPLPLLSSGGLNHTPKQMDDVSTFHIRPAVRPPSPSSSLKAAKTPPTTILPDPRFPLEGRHAVALKDPILPKDDVSQSGERDIWTRREHARAAGRRAWGSRIKVGSGETDAPKVLHLEEREFCFETTDRHPASKHGWREGNEIERWQGEDGIFAEEPDHIPVVQRSSDDLKLGVSAEDEQFRPFDTELPPPLAGLNFAVTRRPASKCRGTAALGDETAEDVAGKQMRAGMYFGGVGGVGAGLGGDVYRLASGWLRCSKETWEVLAVTARLISRRELAARLTISSLSRRRQYLFPIQARLGDLSVETGEISALQQRIIAETSIGYDMRGAEGSSLSAIFWIANVRWLNSHF
ncbi:hypothetical protein EDD85DRAFT_793340 [Armillaria nabsnona]|nr:hypothetical protein EDD85DRAFT_793340 [Armillaria nabsnona]